MSSITKTLLQLLRAFIGQRRSRASDLEQITQALCYDALHVWLQHEQRGLEVCVPHLERALPICIRIDGRSRHPLLLPLLGSRMRSLSPVVRRAAVRALGRMEYDPEIEEELCRCLRDRSAGVRFAAAEALRHQAENLQNRPAVADALLKLLAEQHSDVKQEAIRALFRLAEEAPALRAALLTKSRTDRFLRHQAVQRGLLEADAGSASAREFFAADAVRFHPAVAAPIRTREQILRLWEQTRTLDIAQRRQAAARLAQAMNEGSRIFILKRQPVVVLMRSAGSSEPKRSPLKD